MGVQPVDLEIAQPIPCSRDPTPIDRPSNLARSRKEYILSPYNRFSRSPKSGALGRRDLEIVQPIPCRRGPIPIDRPSNLARSREEYIFGPYNRLSRSPKSGALGTEARLKQMEYQHSKLVEAFEQCSHQMKLFIATSLDNKHMTPECAREVEMIVQCMDKNVKIALNSGGHFFTLSALLDKLNMQQDLSSMFAYAKFYGTTALYIAKLTDRAIKCIGTTHGCFNAIGKEAKRILDTDDAFDKLSSNCDPFDNVSFGVGAQIGGDRSIGQLMFKVKNEKNSIGLNLKWLGEVANAAGNAAGANVNNDILSTRISLDKPWGLDMKCVAEILYPNFNGKFEVGGVFPYMVCAGGLEFKPNPAGAGLPRIPVLDLSALLGMKYAGVGLQLQYMQGQLSPAIGISIRTKVLAAGLTCKFPGHFNATFCKELVDSSTTVAGQACYSPYPGENQALALEGLNPPGFRFAVGLKHSFDTSLYCKARLGTVVLLYLLRRAAAPECTA